MEIIRFLTKLNHKGVISRLMSRTQVFGTIVLCFLCFGNVIYILCKNFHRSLLRASWCQQLNWMPFHNSTFHVFGVAGSVSILAPFCKLSGSSNQLWRYYPQLASLLCRFMKWNCSEKNMKTKYFFFLLNFLSSLNLSSLLCHTLSQLSAASF